MSNRTTSPNNVNGSAYVPLPDDYKEAHKIPTTGPRGAAYRKAVMTIAGWEIGREGQDRRQVLNGLLRRIRNELEIAAEDVPALILRNVRLAGVKAFTESEIKAAWESLTIGPKVEGEPQMLRGIRPAEVKTRAIDWFLPKLIARGYYTMVSGKRGVGKSTFFTGMAAKARHCLWLCGEEGLEDMVVPRLKVHGIGEDAIQFFTREHDLRFPHCKNALIHTARVYKTDLIIIDPLTAFLGLTADANSNEQMQPVLQSLAEVAEKTRAAVLVCLHPGKAQGNTIRGASVFNTHPRVILELLRDEGPPPRRLISNTKNNLVSEQPAREFFADQVHGSDVRRFRLGGELDEATTQLATDVPDRLERCMVRDCEEWMKDMLAEGPVMVKEIVAEGKDEGYSTRTIYRAARDHLRVGRIKGNSRRGDGVQWHLPDWVPENPFDAPPSEEVGN